MSAIVINLRPSASEKLSRIAQCTGKTRDDVVNDAIEQLEDVGMAVATVPGWKAAMMRAAGIWKDREDIPALMRKVREEWDRAMPAHDIHD